MRQLKYHEKKLLKKQDFFDWQNVSSIKKAEVVRRYRLGSRNDYNSYSIVVGYITKIHDLITKLSDEDPFKGAIKRQLLEKLYETGVISHKEDFDLIKKITVSAFLRRRFLIQVKLLKFVENLTEAETFIQHGHFMVGTEVVKDPDFLVSRKMTDHITWNDKSKIKQKVKEFNNQKDDYELLN